MTTYKKDFNHLDEAALQLLVDTETPEGYHLEYKERITNLISLVEEIVAFANTQGGDLFIGIKEEAGIPVSIEGLELTDPDAETLRLNHALMNNTDPQITQAQIRAIPLANGKFVIAIRVNRSWSGPHRVTQNYKFLIRTSAGKYPVGTAELRRLFGIRDNFMAQYEKFRFSRIEKANSTYRIPEPYVMVHYVPVSAFDLDLDYPVVEQREKMNLPILGDRGSSPTINAYGLFYRYLEKESHYGGHTQLFRNGIIEQVSNLMFMSRSNDGNGKKKIMRTTYLEQYLKEGIYWQFKNYEEIGMKDPLFIFMNLVGVEGVTGANYGPPPFIGAPQQIDDYHLQLPEIYIDKQDEETVNIAVQKIMTVLWNAFGFPNKP